MIDRMERGGGQARKTWQGCVRGRYDKSSSNAHNSRKNMRVRRIINTNVERDGQWKEYGQ